MYIRVPRTNDVLLQRFEEWLSKRAGVRFEPLGSQWEIIRARTDDDDGAPLVAYRRASGRESWSPDLRELFVQFCKTHKEP